MKSRTSSTTSESEREDPLKLTRLLPTRRVAKVKGLRVLYSRPRSTQRPTMQQNHVPMNSVRRPLNQKGSSGGGGGGYYSSTAAATGAAAATGQVEKHGTTVTRSSRYPHRLNMYQDPPMDEITVEEFEEWAIDRLRRESRRGGRGRLLGGGGGILGVATALSPRARARAQPGLVCVRC
jgi:hypothetical protein